MNQPLIKRTLFTFFAAVLFAGITLKAQQTAHTIILDKMNYLLQLPEGYNDEIQKDWPLMVFLHGAGETGDDVEKVKLLGPPRKIADGYKYPFIVVSPQSPEHGWNADFVRRLVLDLQKRYRIDEDRTYLTGLSMGGFGTWRTAQSYPELFAAIIPICGGGDSYNPWSLENMPVWCFHGDKDDVVDIKYSQGMIDSLKPYNNPNVKFTVYPGVGHDSWTETYNNEDVYKWMLSHKRFKYEETPMTDAQLQEYTGKYIRTEYNETMEMVVKDNHLQTYWGDDSYGNMYKYAGNDVFFIEPTRYQNVKFTRDKDNKVSGMTVYYNRFRMDYKKQ
ncbi:MAG: dienelactone hydrolase family protein [Prevotella sp.]|jgi:poly(3-hydroxybutyrate) depolymerase|nr:dienelactone hydrolase family protein [Prevotella sp.]